MQHISGRWFGRGMLCMSMLFGRWDEACGQEYIRDFYPYWRDQELYTPLLQSDTTLFYRAVQLPADTYAAASDYTLPQVAGGRRGSRYADQTALLEGVPVTNYRSRTLLQLLGAAESFGSEAAFVPEHAATGGQVRMLRFDERPQTPPAYLAVALTDRNYRVGVRGRWAGPLGNGWQGAAALDLRTGRDLHVPGVFTDAGTAGARFVKRGADDHRIELCFTLPLSIYGGRSASTREAFELTGDRYYNPAWGYQNGAVRNARVRRELLPMLHLTWQRPVATATTFTLTLGAEAGQRAFSGLNWYDARTPQPDHYRYLPSYTDDSETGAAWRSGDPHFTQIDWDRLYALNRLAGGAARYTLEEEVEQPLRLSAALRFTTRPESRLQLHYGLEAGYRQARRFKRMRDLLGADYLVDIDQYLVDDDTYGNLLQNNLRNPDRRIGKGDRFGYDFTLFEPEVRGYFQFVWSADRLRAGAAAAFGSALRYRRGHYEKELFPGEGSYGNSRRMHFAPWSLQAFAGWAFSPRSYLAVNATAAAAAPDAEALFYQPLYNNRTVESPRTELHLAADATWRLRGRQAEWQTAIFVTAQQHLSYTARYYDDRAGVYADQSVAGTAIATCGVETALRLYLGRRWQLTAAGSWIRSRYTRNPEVTIRSDVDNSLIDERAVSYLGDCRPGGVPQATATAGIHYHAPAGWGFRLSGGYAGGRCVEPEPVRRTQRIFRLAGTTPETFALLVEQEQLPDAFTLDANLYKTFRLGRQARLTLTLAARNLTDDAAPYNGYESPRIRRHYAGDFLSWEPQANRYTYVYPRSFYLSAVCRF